MKKKSVAIPVTLATGVLAVGTVGFQANQVSADTIVPTVSEEQAAPVKVVSEQGLASAQAAVTEAEQVLKLLQILLRLRNKLLLTLFKALWRRLII